MRIEAAPGGEAPPSLRFAVAASPAERRGEAPDTEFLKALASTSGGAYFTRDEAEKWLQSLPKPRRETQRVVVTDIWNHPLAAVTLLGLLSAEWWLRRRRGLA